MLDEDQRAPLGIDAGRDHLHQRVTLLDRHAGGGLIEQQKVGLAHQRHPELKPLAIAEAEVRHPVTGAIGKAHGVEHLAGAFRPLGIDRARQARPALATTRSRVRSGTWCRPITLRPTV